MSSLNNQKQELAKYTKEDLIIAILKHDFRGYILSELPLIKYARMCIEAQNMSDKAQVYMNSIQAVMQQAVQFLLQKDMVAAQIIQQYGEGALSQVAKLHFANTEKARKLVK